MKTEKPEYINNEEKHNAINKYYNEILLQDLNKYYNNILLQDLKEQNEN